MDRQALKLVIIDQNEIRLPSYLYERDVFPKKKERNGGQA